MPSLVMLIRGGPVTGVRGREYESYGVRNEFWLVGGLVSFTSIAHKIASLSRPACVENRFFKARERRKRPVGRMPPVARNGLVVNGKHAHSNNNHLRHRKGCSTSASGAPLSNKRVHDWTLDDVHDWLETQGFSEYASDIAYTHKVDGETLLQLTEADMRERPLSMTCLGDIKRLVKAIRTLKHDDLLLYMDSPDGNMVQLDLLDTETVIHKRTSELSVLENMSNHSREFHRINLLTREDIIRQVESPDTKNKSMLKLAIAFSYCLLSLLITAFVMVLVHDRVPDMKTYPPLPDIVLDNLPLIPWAFEVCEIIAVCMATFWLGMLFLHKHRVVIMRRMFSLIGTVFLLRCITMLITSLSVPGVHLECRAKSYGSFSDKLWQAYHIWSRLGMSIQGVRSCGDYMFSGHTTAITLLNHFITEYTPESWYALHTFTWVLNLFGVFFILAGHEHYSIDVFIAFYISSRMFLYYHAYAYNHPNLTATDSRVRLWFPLGWFFESGGNGRVKNEYEFPLTFGWLYRLRKGCAKKMTPPTTPEPEDTANGRRRKGTKKIK
uniref:SAM domain-containing protein n=1 Tax=Steinernema glaseri TaxID=37863 RepID=A0A1I7ZX19_9BILA